MKKKSIVIGLVALVFGGLIVGLILNKQDKPKGELNVSLGAEPNSLDPAISLTIDVRSYLSNLFEGLVNLDEKGNVVEGVAKEWSANDENTEYTFKLRENAKWTDGSNVKAQDFKYSWLRVLDPNTASGWASYLYYIENAEDYNNGTASKESVGITVVDDYTLKVTLENPCSFFVSMTALQPYYPVKESAVTAHGDNWSNSAETFVSNGAFKLENWKHDSKITIVKNNTYWDNNKIKLSKINFVLFSDSNVVLNAYEAKNIDYVENVLTSEEMKQVGTVQSSDFVYTKFLSFNLNREVFQNVNVRKAISLALDREAIAEIMGEQMQPLTSFIPYGFYNDSENKDYTEDSNSRKYLDKNSKIAEAKQLLKDAGYENGVGLSKITYLTNTSSSNTALAEIVKNQLQAIGINVEIQALEKKVFNTYRSEKNFDIVAASWAAEYPDITSYLYGFRSTDLNNYSSFNNEDFDQKYTEILLSDSIQEKFALVHQAENLVMDSYCVAPLYMENTFFIHVNNLKGFYHDVTGCLNFSRAYFN